MRYRSSFSPLRSIERTFILTQIPIAESAARPPHNLPRVRSLAAFGRRPWCSPLHLDGPSSETLNKSRHSLWAWQVRLFEIVEQISRAQIGIDRISRALRVPEREISDKAAIGRANDPVPVLANHALHDRRV